ncbi:MAG: glycosyltransferase, partial [Spirochaetaceae bacterium]|nr:glycosyltransferase [Spirochaetaceae bacterium]
SLSEGLPRVVIEAMAHGCAVIANDVGGTNQIISHGSNGYIETPMDTNGWKRNFTTLITNRNERNRVGEAAVHTVLTSFSINQFREQILEAFRPAG